MRSVRLFVEIRIDDGRRRRRRETVSMSAAVAAF